MLTLDLDFINEIEIPNTLVDFIKILESKEFKYGFKIYLNKLVPINSEDGLKGGAITNFKIKDTKELYNFVINELKVGDFYYLKNGTKFEIYIDKDINEGKIGVEVKKELSFFKKLAGKIIGVDVYDFYIEQIIVNYLEETNGYKNRIFDLIIRDKGESFSIKFNEYLLDNGGNADSNDKLEREYAGAYSGSSTVLNKEKLTLKVG